MQAEIRTSVLNLRWICVHLCSWPFILVLAGSALAESATLHPIADTSLFENSPDNNLGSNSNLVAGANGSGLRGRILFRFDVANQIPSNAVVQSVALKLNVVTVPGGGGEPSIFDLHRTLVSWKEGTGAGNAGTPANADETTWNNRFHPSTPWTMPGAGMSSDFSETVSDSLLITNLGNYTFTSNTNLVSDVQAWLQNPTENFGWIMIGESEDTAFTAKRFGSREDTNNWPSLVVQYSLPVAPKIGSIGLVGDQIQFSFLAVAGQPYTVQFCSSLASANWLTLANISSQAATTNLIISDLLSTNAQRFYRIGVFESSLN